MADSSDDFYRLIFDSARVGIYETTGDGWLLRANAHLATMFGYANPAEMHANPGHVGDRFYARRADRERFARLLRTEGAVSEFVCEGKRNDGGRLWFSQSAVREVREDGVEVFLGTMLDVTALVEAQDRALQAEAAYRSMFENASLGIYRSTPDGRQLRANPALVRFNGYASESELLAAVEDIATEWYVEPGRRDEFKRLIARDGRVAGFVSEVYRHRTRERVWISESAWAVTGPDGRLFCYEGIVEDITERHNAQARLAEAKAQAEAAEQGYRSIFENASFGIYRVLPDGTPLRTNRALARINGFDDVAAHIAAVEAAQARSMGDYVAPGRADEFLAALTAAGEVRDFESEIVRRGNGERAWISENAWAVRDASGALVAIEGTVADITERRLAEARLRSAERDYRSIFENADFGIYRTGVDGLQTRSNMALARINGFKTPQEQIDAVIKVGDSGRGWYVDPDALRRFRTLRARDGYVRNFEAEVVRRGNGERAWISENGWEVRDAAGNVIAYEGTVTDITERKRAEVELHQAKAAAEAASAAKGAFLAVMSHELRTPLNAIIGFAEIISQRLFGPDDPRYFEYAEDIHISGRHLLALINDILDLSKITAGRLDLVEAPVRLADLVAGVAKLFAASAKKADVALTADVQDASLTIQGDAMRLRQVLMNLVSNAVKFTPAGGQVRVFVSADETAIRIGVADTGVGMTPEEAARAVEPFVQVDTRLARRHEGTGLGLSISKELVALHGGVLSIESEKGRGTRVTAVLPASRRLTDGAPD
jgi:PAS domain S-box-containing protein